MKPDLHQPSSPATGPRTLRESGSVVPVWLVVIMVLMLYWGGLYFDEHSGWFDRRIYAPYSSLTEIESLQPRTSGPDLNRGRALFNNICALCHGLEGEGKPGQAPPLAGSDWVQGSPNRLVRIPLVGLTGPISVSGKDYALPVPMTAMGAALSDDDLSAVLSYVRQSFGNKAEPVTGDQVNKIRGELKGRTQPLTMDELKKIPEK